MMEVISCSEANLQADGLVERPAQGAADWWETKEDSFSPQLTNVVPCPKATYRLSQYEL